MDVRAVDHDPEVELMLRAQRGDKVAFDELYLRIRLPVFRYCRRLLGDPVEAEEAAQEVLLKVWRSRERYMAGARFRTWLFRVATNHCLNERRRAWRHREVGSEEGTAGLDKPAPIGADPHRQQEGRQLAEAVEKALAALPERQRAAVLLARYEGCSMKEISEVLEVTEGGAKALLNRARTQLSEHLSPFLEVAS